MVNLDNGSAMVSSQLLRALAILGITLTHSKPGQPAGRGKIEKFFRTVREQFLVELAAPGALAAVEDLVRLNELFAGWVETVYHARVHSETGQKPLERFLAPGPPSLPTAQMLHEAFLWSQRRRVTKTATISLHGNRYEVDAALVGRTVEVVFDPFDLTTLQIRYQGRSMGIAVPHRIGRHVHPDARPELPPAPATPTGIDYLALVAAGHRAQLAARINYTDLPTGHPVEGPVESNKIDNEIDERLEAELASFAALRDQHRRDQHRRPHSHQVVADGELPGQLDLTSLTDEPDEPDEHHSNDDSRQGPR